VVWGQRAFRLAILLLSALAPVTRLAPAQADENASQCCAVLDARIAELANAVLDNYVNDIKVQTYGHVNRAILFWNDGINSRVSFVDNNTSSSRLGFIGEGTFRPGLTVGARFETEFVWPSSSEIFDHRNVTRDQSLTDVAVRQAYGFIDDEHLGIFTFGHQWSASGDLTLINLGSQMNDAALHYNNGFGLGLKLAGGTFTDLKWGKLAENVDVRGATIFATTRLRCSDSWSQRPLAQRTLGMSPCAITPTGKLFALLEALATATTAQIFSAKSGARPRCYIINPVSTSRYRGHSATTCSAASLRNLSRILATYRPASARCGFPTGTPRSMATSAFTETSTSANC